jgi:hypothetical protein
MPNSEFVYLTYVTQKNANTWCGTDIRMAIACDVRIKPRDINMRNMSEDLKNPERIIGN